MTKMNFKRGQILTETNEQKFRRLVDAFNEGNQDGTILELVSPDFQVTNAPPGTPTDRDGWIASTKMYHAAFPDIHVKIVDVVANGDDLAVREVVTGTHSGDLMGMAPTGKSATVEAVHFIRFENGLIVERKSMTDMLALFVQLGLVTLPSP